MTVTAIQEVGLGARLVEPIRDAAGGILVAAGERLTPSILERLESWSIGAVDVDDATPSSMGVSSSIGEPVVVHRAGASDDAEASTDWRSAWRESDRSRETRIIADALSLWSGRRPDSNESKPNGPRP